MMIYWKKLDEPIRLQRSDHYFNYYQHYGFVSCSNPIHTITSNWAILGSTNLIEWTEE